MVVPTLNSSDTNGGLPPKLRVSGMAQSLPDELTVESRAVGLPGTGCVTLLLLAGLPHQDAVLMVDKSVPSVIKGGRTPRGKLLLDLPTQNIEEDSFLLTTPVPPFIVLCAEVRLLLSFASE